MLNQSSRRKNANQISPNLGPPGRHHLGLLSQNLIEQTRPASVNPGCWSRTRTKAYFARPSKSGRWLSRLYSTRAAANALADGFAPLASRSLTPVAKSSAASVERTSSSARIPIASKPRPAMANCLPRRSKAGRFFRRVPHGFGLLRARFQHARKNYGTLRMISTFQAKAK